MRGRDAEPPPRDFAHEAKRDRRAQRDPNERCVGDRFGDFGGAIAETRGGGERRVGEFLWRFGGSDAEIAAEGSSEGEEEGARAHLRQSRRGHGEIMATMESIGVHIYNDVIGSSTR